MIGIVVVLAVGRARRADPVAGQAAEVDAPLREAVINTAAPTELRTTIDHAEVIVAGLARGRDRLGG